MQLFDGDILRQERGRREEDRREEDRREERWERAGGEGICHRQQAKWTQ